MGQTLGQLGAGEGSGTLVSTETVPMDGGEERPKGKRPTMKGVSDQAVESPPPARWLRRVASFPRSHPGSMIILSAPLLGVVGFFLPQGSIAATLVLGAAVALAFLGAIIAIATSR